MSKKYPRFINISGFFYFLNLLDKSSRLHKGFAKSASVPLQRYIIKLMSLSSLSVYSSKMARLIMADCSCLVQV